MNTELSVKTTINDIETKLDKKQNLYFKLYGKWNDKTQVFYAFANQLTKETFRTLKETPEKLVNQLAIIKGYSIVLCAKHIHKLEQLLGEKLESLTRNYEPNNLWIQSS